MLELSYIGRQPLILLWSEHSKIPVVRRKIMLIKCVGLIHLKFLAVINLMNWPGYASVRYPVSYGRVATLESKMEKSTRRQSDNLEILKNIETPIYIVIQCIYQYFNIF